MDEHERDDMAKRIAKEMLDETERRAAPEKRIKQIAGWLTFALIAGASWWVYSVQEAGRQAAAAAENAARADSAR